MAKIKCSNAVVFYFPDSLLPLEAEFNYSDYCPLYRGETDLFAMCQNVLFVACFSMFLSFDVFDVFQCGEITLQLNVNCFISTSSILKLDKSD